VASSPQSHFRSADEEPFLGGGMAIVLALALAKLALHCCFNNRYDYFRDEFDYMACGNHLAWGFVDQPPLVPFLVKLSRLLFGDSLRSIRLLAAAASSGAVVLTAMIARELGGKRFGLILAATAVMIAPIYLSDGSLMTTNAFEPLLWAGCLYFAILAVKRNRPRYWLWFGIVAGIGLEEKYSILVLGLGIVAGLLLTPQRRAFRSRWFWLGGAAAFLIFLPNLLWNVQNHWPFLELTRNIKAEGRDVQLSPLQYFAQQIVLLHPLAAPIWITGLAGLFFARRWRSYRMLGWTYLAGFAIFAGLHGKNYYLTPIYPVLLAAGAVLVESGMDRLRQPWWKPALIGTLATGGALLAPIVVPVLPVDQFISYMNHLPFAIPRSEKSHMAAVLPQHYADQFGWEEMTAAVAQAWNRLPADERPDCGIFAQNYGEAGAIDFFGPRYSLPPALSGHQTYWLWGPRGYSGNCLLVLSDGPEQLRRLFEQVEYEGSSDNPHALERHVPIYLCKRSKFGSLAQAWPRLKQWR
jgi:4-amino-4-deoxy-L-arabinose transferase-like glycosyltransferase